MMSDILSIWAKTVPVSPRPREPCFHPLLYHSLDVAAVAQALLAQWPQWLILWQRIGLSEDEFARFLVFCCALHDIGKCSVHFQSRERDLWPGGRFGAWPRELLTERSHGDITALYLLAANSQPVAPLFRAAIGTGAAKIVSAIAGHHGRPLGDSRRLKGHELTANRPFREAAAEIVAAIASVLDGATMPALRIDDDSAAELSWLLSALLPVCDWVGSNQNWFPANVSCHDARTYWEHVAKPQAAKALVEAGLSRAEFAAPAPSRTLGHLPGAALTPLQDTAFTYSLSAAEPTLILIEDATGSGKTETALTLAHRLMAQGSASGFYFALPTMATANAMYARLTKTYRAMFDDADTHQPSLALAHGKALRNEGFLRSLKHEPARNGRGQPDTSAFCSGWIADSRRKALLAQAGAGTIDQALMAVLPLRYQSIRLHGLIGKVLILDEIHSFDAFMLKLIETLLELHSKLGGSAIVMSATLPKATRARLLKAFAKGRGLASPAAYSGAYPLVTALCADRVTQTPLPLAPGTGRRVAVERIASVGEAEALALALARGGAAVALIRSTVDAAIASFERLKADHDDCELFHARFLLDDRLAIEACVLNRFGKAGAQAGREGRILVATQVVEQSLDIDFDSVITDLAPMDLLIQRAGRLWRHRRPDRPVAGPVLHVVSPAPTDACEADWLKADLQEAEWVYEDPARLWLTARRLFDAGVIVTATLADRQDIAGHVRGLIEAAYTDDSAALPTPSLAGALDRFAGMTIGKSAMAGHTVLKPNAGYVSDIAWETEARAVTRLELRPRVTARLARRDGNMLRPLIGEDWSLAELRLSLKLAQGLAAPKDDEDGLLRPAWAEADEGAVLLVLEPDVEGWKSADGRFAYDTTHGLRRFGAEKTG